MRLSWRATVICWSSLARPRLAKRWLCRRERRQSMQASTILSASPRGLVNITS
jgi:hypothetical protein